MFKEIPLILATTNKYKIMEIGKLLEGFSVNLKSLDHDRTLPEIAENGDTFEDNAYKKAFETASMVGIPAMAEDSGLVVKALGGAPGVYSARYAGEKQRMMITSISFWRKCPVKKTVRLHSNVSSQLQFPRDLH